MKCNCNKPLAICGQCLEDIHDNQIDFEYSEDIDDTTCKKCSKELKKFDLIAEGKARII